MRPPKRLTLPFLAVFLILATLLMAGCFADEPSKDHVKIVLESSFTQKKSVEIAKVEPKWVKTGEARLEGKAAISIRLKENYYIRASLNDELAALELDSAETSLLRHALSQAAAQAEPLRSSLLEKAPQQSLEKQLFIKLSEKSGDTFPGEVSLKAQKTVDGWNLRIEDISIPHTLNGNPRSSIPEGATVVGSPEAEKLVKEGIEATRRYAALVEKAVADAGKAQSEALTKKRKALLEALKSGAIFMGTAEFRDKSVSETGLVVGEAQEGSGIVKGYVFESKDPRRKTPFTGAMRDAAIPLVLNIPADAPETVAELDLKDGRLVGTFVNRKDKTPSAVISWAPVAKEVLDAKIAAVVAAENERKAEGERRAAERKKQLDTYQAALARAVAPGSAFQGIWSYSNERGEVGLAIESVSANGLSCAGYLFDPSARFKRKPFTGTINRSHEAQDALIVSVVRGQGVAPSSKTTRLYEYWLAVDKAYSLTLTLKNGGWEGQTNGRFAVALSPVSGFAELLAKDQEAEKKRQEALRTAVAPGTAWQGTFTCRSYNGEVGIYFESGKDSQVKGYLFDPAARAVRKTFTGTVSYDREVETPLALEMDRNSGLEYKNDMPKFHQGWLRNDHAYQLRFTEAGGMLHGKEGNDCSLELKPLANYAALLAQDAEAEKKRQEALRTAVAPGTAWQGTFTCRSYNGEVGIYFESGKDSQVKGYLFDPAARAVRKTFTGTVSYDREVETPLALEMDRNSGLEDKNGMPKFHQDWLRNNHAYQLRFTEAGGMLHGKEGNDCSLELKPLANYAALLAQDAEAEKKRQEALTDAVKPGVEYVGTWQSNTHAGEIGMRTLTLGSSGVVFTAEMFAPEEPAVAWLYNGSLRTVGDERQLTLVPNTPDRLKGKSAKQSGSTQDMLNDNLLSYNTVTLTLTAEGLSGKIYSTPVVFKKISAPAAAASTPAPQATAPAPAAAIPTPAAAAYPPLIPNSNGKPRVAAHRVPIESGTVELALQVLAPGKTIESVRIDNVGGVSSLWRSDGKEGATPLSVSCGGKNISSGAQAMAFATGETEVLFSLSLKDNGAFAGKQTDFRVTVFFVGGERALCQISAK